MDKQAILDAFDRMSVVNVPASEPVVTKGILEEILTAQEGEYDRDNLPKVANKYNETKQAILDRLPEGGDVWDDAHAINREEFVEMWERAVEKPLIKFLTAMQEGEKDRRFTFNSGKVATVKPPAAMQDGECEHPTEQRTTTFMEWGWVKCQKCGKEWNAFGKESE